MYRKRKYMLSLTVRQTATRQSHRTPAARPQQERAGSMQQRRRTPAPRPHLSMVTTTSLQRPAWRRAELFKATIQIQSNLIDWGLGGEGVIDAACHSSSTQSMQRQATKTEPGLVCRKNKRAEGDQQCLTVEHKKTKYEPNSGRSKRPTWEV